VLSAEQFSEQWPRIVSAGMAPVVVISACALMALAFYNRFASIISRLRAFGRERLMEQEQILRLEEADPPDEDAIQRRRRILQSLSEQTRRTLRRAKLIRLTLICLLGTISMLLVSSLLNGMSVIWPDALFGAAILFLAGMGLLLFGIVCAMAELLVALEVVEDETRVVSGLTDSN
jgi:hypothetical protein